ncbi:unnamed protein product [Ilex paraguariensis]|uniref:Uncharacterized protein n=1 Tax=Ilex paraguariensis TaxID=185542 RepID=A0ABC8SZ25_9AQUA
MSSSSSSSANHQHSFADEPPPNLPLREIPYSYGLPFFGVFRSTNMPPFPFMALDPKVDVVLDGTFITSTSITGSYRPCANLDPSEPSHAVLKDFFLSLLSSFHNKSIPSFHLCLWELFINLEDELSDKVKASSILDQAESVGIKRDEACHNLVFLSGFNAYASMKALFSGLIKWVRKAGESLHQQLSDEIRTVVKEEGGVTLSALETMTLTKSVVCEVLRIELVVQFQCGKAKEDIVVHSHNSTFQIKKGEMIFGYQPMVTKDPIAFANPDDIRRWRISNAPDKAVALKQLRTHVIMFGAWVAVIRVTPYVLHYFSDSKEELKLDL